MGQIDFQRRIVRAGTGQLDLDFSGLCVDGGDPPAGGDGLGTRGGDLLGAARIQYPYDDGVSHLEVLQLDLTIVEEDVVRLRIDVDTHRIDTAGHAQPDTIEPDVFVLQRPLAR